MIWMPGVPVLLYQSGVNRLYSTSNLFILCWSISIVRFGRREYRIPARSPRTWRPFICSRNTLEPPMLTPKGFEVVVQKNLRSTTPCRPPLPTFTEDAQNLYQVFN